MMKKKILAILLVMTVSLISCGNQAEVQELTAGTVTSSEALEQTTEKSEENGNAEETEVTEESKEATKTSSEALDASKDSKEASASKEVSASKDASKNSVEDSSKEAAASAASKQPSSTGTIANTTQAQQPTAAPKPTLEPTSAPEVSQPAPHSCTWDGGTVTTNATCNQEGVKTYRCSCGNTRTESIAKTSHNYITESTAATCTEAGRTKTYCTNCGDVQAEGIGEAATGHVEKKAYWDVPSCNGYSYYHLVCAKCNEYLGDGTDEPLPHTPVETITQHGNCIAATVIRIDCGVCGAPLGQEAHTEPDDHDWITGEAEQFNEETLEWEMVQGTYCSRCGRHPE